MISIENIIIEEEPYKRLIHLLSQNTNLRFEYYRRNFIERRIKARMIRVKCSTLEEYYDYFLSDFNEVNKFIEAFNINYSYFFRNFDLFEKFQEFILDSLNIKPGCILGDLSPNPSNSFNQKIIERRINYNKDIKNDYNTFQKNVKAGKTFLLNNVSNKPSSTAHFLNRVFPLEQTSLFQKLRSPNRSRNTLNIWSCPCASGEEPYSIAMILNNLKKQIPTFPNYIINASDIDPDAINNAKIGIYNDNSMKDTSKYYEENYFDKKKDNFGYKYRINEEIKQKINFINEDVTKGHLKPIKYDVVFCRYLLIYISRELRNKFLEILENQMVPGGLLILGKTETLFNSFSSFKLVDTRNHIYIKSHQIDKN